MTNEIAPPIQAKRNENFKSYPDPSTRLGQAWTAAWKRLAADPEAFQASQALSLEVAGAVGVSPATVANLLARAAKADLLSIERRAVGGTRGVRTRVFYRINAERS